MQKSEMYNKVNKLNKQLNESIQQKGSKSSTSFINGKLDKIIYKDNNNVIIREDAYTYNGDLITEVIKLDGVISKTTTVNIRTKEIEVLK